MTSWAGGSKTNAQATHMERSIFSYLFCLLLLVLVPSNVGGRVVSNAEVNVQHKSILKSIQVDDGNIFDCYLLRKQPAFSTGPVMRGHNIQMEPTFYPRHLSDQMMENSLKEVDFGRIGCPIGSVPIHRTNYSLEHPMVSPLSTKEVPTNISTSKLNDEYYTYYAVHGTPAGVYYGAKASIGIWAVDGVSPTQGSGAYLYVGGDDQSNEHIAVGWFVYPRLYQDNQPRFTTFWKGKEMAGACMNTQCPGYVHVHPHYSLGSIFSNVSSGDIQFYITVTLDKDPVTHAWWLYVGDDRIPIGYWESRLFSDMPLWTRRVAAGGMVYGPTSEKTPPMGDGRLPHFIPAESSHIAHIFIIDEKHTFYNPWRDIQDKVETKPLCYKVTDINNDGERGALFAYGGPSDCRQ